MPGTQGSGYDLDHLPYGVIALDGDPRPVVRIGAHALDLRACHRAGLLDDAGWAEAPTLDGLVAAGQATWVAVRRRVTALLSDDGGTRPPDGALLPLAEVPAPSLPVTVGDYVDFYSSIHHATNVGRIFRPEGEPLTPNWRHMPIGYHGRSGTVVVSGTPIRRPVGQRRPSAPGDVPPVGPSTTLDLELEVGFITGGPSTALGERITTAAAPDRIFGVALLNDWSARDLQSWEYVPLGPFLGKSFATSLAGWITPLAALEAARVPARPQDPPVVDYLRVEGDWALDLTLEVAWQPAGARAPEVVSRTSFADMYWTMPQQLAHASVNGAVVRPGDLFGSGTVSGPERGTEGCLLEATWGGTVPLTVAGVERTYLADGDTITLTGHCRGLGGGRLQLGEVIGTVLAAG